MAVCEDAPCCGCCGQIAWAREDEATAEAYMDWAEKQWADYEPDEEPDEVAECGFCGTEWLAGQQCPECDNIIDTE